MPQEQNLDRDGRIVRAAPARTRFAAADFSFDLVLLALMPRRSRAPQMSFAQPSAVNSHQSRNQCAVFDAGVSNRTTAPLTILKYAAGCGIALVKSVELISKRLLVPEKVLLTRAT